MRSHLFLWRDDEMMDGGDSDDDDDDKLGNPVPFHVGVAFLKSLLGTEFLLPYGCCIF